MDAGSTRWKAVTQTQYPWEREALDFVRERLPDHDPYLAWANFEFVAEGGSVNEVDLLVLTPKGLFLVEIKSRPGTVTATCRIGSGRTRTGSGRRTTRSSSRTARPSA